MRIAYCDDEIPQYVFLKELTDRWEKTSNVHCDITVYKSAEEMLFENQKAFPFDFIILDIELDRMNGVDLARHIRNVDKNVLIAFLSNSRKYVFEGYEVGAVRYLIKPLSAEQLYPLLTMADKASAEEKRYIIIGAAGDKIKLNTDDICYAEAFGHYVVIHTEKQSFEVKMNINDIAGRLGPDFIAAHRSFLVNLKYVERITRTDCILNTGTQIPISRNSYKAVNQAFIGYYKGGMPE